MNVEVEVWKTIDGYEDYQVSNLGRVKSLLFNRERILKYFNDCKGYLSVKISKNKKPKTIKVHTLVAMMFLGHKPDGTHKVCVDHIDNNKLNNRADNLQLISNRKNASKDRIGGTSNYVGVYLHSKHNKWVSSITFLYRCVYLGYFDSEIEAKNAYDKALSELNQGLDLNVLYPKGRNKTSKFKYVFLNNESQTYTAKCKNKYLGCFKTEEEAYESLQKYINQLNENKENGNKNYESKNQELQSN